LGVGLAALRVEAGQSYKLETEDTMAELERVRVAGMTSAGCVFQVAAAMTPRELKTIKERVLQYVGDCQRRREAEIAKYESKVAALKDEVAQREPSGGGDA